jgi:hypothetical protein
MIARRSLQVAHADESARAESLDVAAGEEDAFNSPYMLVMRMRNRTITPADIERLGKGADAWFASEGKLALCRCLGIKVTTTREWHIAERNLWLARAAAMMPVKGAWLPYARLQLEWSRFLSTGPWRLWRDDDAPPASASPLERCLFFATKHNKTRDGEARDLSADAIRRAVCAVSGGNAN